MTGASKTTVMKLLSDLGLVCSIYLDRAMRDLPCERIQCDEIWSFVYSKQKNVPADKHDEAGDVWTWVAIDADTKLVPSFMIGTRDIGTASAFMDDVAKRMKHRVQLTTDGHRPYLQAVRGAFGRGGVDYAQLVKYYGTDSTAKPERRYSPAVCTGIDQRPILGDPDPDHISTSYVERQNLTMRMSMRRFTRLTNGFSKKMENHAAAIALHFMHYNFVRVHQTLGTTPAVAAGIAEKPWTVGDLVKLLTDAENAVPMKRGPYKKHAA